MTDRARPRILFVDDDANVLKSFRRMLGRDFEVVTAPSGPAALEIMDGAEPFSVIVSDLKMPGMDGIEFLSRAREVDPDAVRMVLTGFANQQNAIDAVNDGYVFRFLTKPCSEADLLGSIRAGVDQYRLIQDQRELKSLKKLKQALEGMIVGFTTLVEARDPYTAGHQRRVTDLAVAIAGRMGMDEDDAAGLRVAAMVHDIGKVYVPAEFLNRPGRLSAEEFAIIRTHPGIGYDILHPVEFPWPVADMVLQHHERLDGSGYPGGLSGGDILPGSRVLSVADVVEAICSHRPYRPGLGLDVALGEVAHMRGTHYDPEVVDACLALFREDGYDFER